MISQTATTEQTDESEAEAVYLPKEELLALDGKTINKEKMDDGRIRETYWKVISTPNNIVYMQTGDKIVYVDSYESVNDRRIKLVEEVSSDICEVSGIHALTSDQDTNDTSPIRLNLIRDHLSSKELFVVGTRTCKYKDKKEFQ